MKHTYDTIINPEISICQPEKGFRFSSDAVFLSWFVKTAGVRRIADVGSGSGIVSALISLMRGIERIDAIEMQDVMYGCLTNTIQKCGLDGRVIPVQADIREFRPQYKYDAIVCNPPYRDPSSGHLPKDETELNARFCTTMNADDLFAFANSFLNYTAGLFLSYDADMMPALFESAFRHGFEAKRLMPVCPDIDIKPKIILMEFRKGGGRELSFESPLYQKINGQISPQVKKILSGEWN